MNQSKLEGPKQLLSVTFGLMRYADYAAKCSKHRELCRPLVPFPIVKTALQILGILFPRSATLSFIPSDVLKRGDVASDVYIASNSADNTWFSGRTLLTFSMSWFQNRPVATRLSL